MAQGIRKAAAWLGLVRDDEDDRYGDDVEQFSEPIYGYEQSEEVSTVTPINRRPASPGHHHEQSQAPEPKAQDLAKADLGRIITVHPRAFNEARTIGEHFRDGVPVIMNLTDMEDSDARRLIDFGAGLIFGLRGTIERVTSKVFLLSPSNVNVTAEDKERIKGGFFNQS